MKYNEKNKNKIKINILYAIKIIILINNKILNI